MSNEINSVLADMLLSALLTPAIKSGDVLKRVGSPFCTIKSFVCEEFDEGTARSIVEELSKIEYQLVASCKADGSLLNRSIYVSANKEDRMYMTVEDWVKCQDEVAGKLISDLRKKNENRENDKAAQNSN